MDSVDTQAITLQNLVRHADEQGVWQPHVVDALELGDLFAQAGEACAARIGLEPAEGDEVRKVCALYHRLLC